MKGISWKALWLILTSIVIAFWFASPPALWKYLFFLRLPIIISLFLFLLPILAQTALKPMLGSIFVLRNKWQLAVVIIGAVVSGLAVVSAASIILVNASARFSVPVSIEVPVVLQDALAIALSLLISVTAFRLSGEKINPSERNWGAIVGSSLSAGLLLLVNYVENQWAGSVWFRQTFINAVSLFGKDRAGGYLDPQSGELLPGHLGLAAFLIIGIVCYAVIGIRFSPRPNTSRTEVPALLYLLLILSIVTILYSGATFYFDFFRVPTLLLFVLYSAFTYFALGVDHEFHVKDLAQDTADKKAIDSQAQDFEGILKKRLSRQSGERTLVIVCASGGGIQAAGWTARVLCGLQELLGESFTQAIGLISSVSGGSVGAMYYLDRFKDELSLPDEQKGYPAKDDLLPIFQSATKDSLDAVGWGLAYPDLWRFIGFPFVASLIRRLTQQDDRGTAIETDWQGEMKAPRLRKTLATWRKQIFQGDIPIPVFNATLVDSGYRLLLSPLTFGHVPERKFIDFNTLYPDSDIDVVTAARLSATFPYVSPICRSSKNFPGRNYHVADGGYFDNSGFATAGQWLNTHLEQWKKPESLNIKRVLILQINAFPESPSTENVTGAGGWFMATVGPLLAMFKVRDPVLAARNRAIAELLKNRWQQAGVDVQYVPIFFPDEQTAPEFYQKGRYRPPLSWRLTDEEKRNLYEGWKAIESGETIQQLKQWWQS